MSCDLRRMRRQHIREWRAELTQELNQADRFGQKAGVARISRLLSARGTGPRRRNYRRAVQ
eukprot:3980027-Pyramimonas_sp.AAC.1